MIRYVAVTVDVRMLKFSTAVQVRSMYWPWHVSPTPNKTSWSKFVGVARARSLSLSLCACVCCDGVPEYCHSSEASLFFAFGSNCELRGQRSKWRYLWISLIITGSEVATFIIYPNRRSFFSSVLPKLHLRCLWYSHGIMTNYVFITIIFETKQFSWTPHSAPREGVGFTCRTPGVDSILWYSSIYCVWERLRMTEHLNNGEKVNIKVVAELP